MDSFESNKIIAAVVVIFVVIFGISKISDIIYYVEKPSQSAYKVEFAETDSLKASKAVEAVDISALLAMGSVEHGKKVFKKCSACHSIKKGGRNNIGPALYNVVNRQVGVVSDYKYSKALTEYGKNWTFEELNGYLIRPAKWIKGTKMAFAGLKKEKDRSSVILYLNQNSDNPLPLP